MVRELTRRDQSFDRARVPWSRTDEAVDALTGQARQAAAAGRPWRVVWCAGAGVVGTSAQQLDAEVGTFAAFLDRLAHDGGPLPEAFFLASSAGGVHAGSTEPPYTELTEPVPISPYGEAKLATEEALREFAARTGVPAVIGRISNLYGPGQDLSKAQGLISQLCQAHHERRALSIFVSLDTARDYLFADDAAAIVTRATDRVAGCDPGTVVVKLVASQRSTTVAMILGELRRLLRRRPLVVLGESPLATFQARDLRFRSVVWTDLDRFARTTLAEGVWATMEHRRLEARRPVRFAAAGEPARILDR